MSMATICIVAGHTISAVSGSISQPHYAPCSYCGRTTDRDQTEASCRGCGGPLRAMQEVLSVNQTSRHDTDREIRRKRKAEEEESRRNESDRLFTQSMNIAMGDHLQTGIPGGLDMDITTPL